MARLARSEVFDPDRWRSVTFIIAPPACFLMGEDPISGKTLTTGKVWIEEYLARTILTKE